MGEEGGQVHEFMVRGLDYLECSSSHKWVLSRE